MKLDVPNAFLQAGMLSDLERAIIKLNCMLADMLLEIALELCKAYDECNIINKN